MDNNNKILVFCCENSAYKAAEAIEDRSVFEQIEMVNLPCLGKIEIGLVLKSFEHDYPGVLILGCPIDNCQYLQGNVRARKRVDMIKHALRDAGYDDQRVRMDFLSSLDAHKFEMIVKEFYESVSSLG